MKNVLERLNFKRGIAVLLMLVMLIPLMFGNVTAEAAGGSPYLIKVNKQMNTVTIYKKDSKGNYTVPHKAMVCSTGWATPLGSYKTPAKYRWKALIEEVWGQYATRITGGILFHSVWYYDPDPSKLSATQYNKLGTTCSHGCIRLTVEDAKWIYDNCPVGTTVTVYNSSNAGPLGKPSAIKLPINSWWDPTDVTNKNNPWNNKKPSISGAADKTVNYGTNVDLKRGVTAKGTTGFDMTSSIKITGTVDTKKPGKYKVTYSITDQIKRTAKKTVTYTVLEDTTTPVISGVKNQVVGPDTVIDEAFALKGVKATYNKEALSAKNIKVSIKKNSKELYTITYKVTAKNGKSASAKAKIEVDLTAPVFNGIGDRELELDQVVDTTFAKKGVTVSDDRTKMTAKDIKVKITDNGDNSYTITYTAKDGVGNTTTETAVFRVSNYLRIEGAVPRTITEQDVLTEELALEGITAYNEDVDITSDIIVEIQNTKDGNYRVTYRVEDETGNEAQVTVIFTVQKAAAVSEE